MSDKRVESMQIGVDEVHRLQKELDRLEQKELSVRVERDRAVRTLRHLSAVSIDVVSDDDIRIQNKRMKNLFIEMLEFADNIEYWEEEIKRVIGK